ncbi:AI-2E family transporter [Deinococcus apachensis]|uniref:AI-2E family transporter n=1 Tax=Deinococcus apachensis TaxID=309886 RepID=UPI0003762B28|nr:AI-2E family transporter [Deinococcus apachensis]
MNSKRTVPQLLHDLWARPQVRLPVYLLGLVLVFLLARRLSGVLLTVGGAYAIAYLINPALIWLEKRGLGRGWGVLLFTLALLAVSALLFWRLADQVLSFVSSLPALADLLTQLLDRALRHPSSVPGVEQLQARLAEYVQTRAAELASNIGPLLDRLLSSSPSLLADWLAWLGRIGLLLTLALYFALDYPRITSGLLKAFPREWQPGLARLSEDVSVSFGRAIRGLLLTGLGVGVLAALGLLLLGVPNPLALGLLTALTWLIPFVGIFIAAIPPLLLALLQGPLTLGLVAALYFVLNQIGGNILGPMIMGRTTRLAPAALLVAVLVGLALGGALGAMLAGPAALLLHRWAVRYWLPSRAYQGQEEPQAVQSGEEPSQNGSVLPPPTVTPAAAPPPGPPSRRPR